MSDSEYLFVYGSLRKNSSSVLHGFLQSQAEFIGYASLPGKLYEVQNYPGAVLEPKCGQWIKGEVYALHNAGKLFQALDDYEECSAQFPKPHEYKRCKTTVNLSDNRCFLAWVYLYNWPMIGLREIEGGDYLYSNQPTIC